MGDHALSQPTMDPTFKSHVEALHPLFEQLVAMEPVKICRLPRDAPRRGIYLFSEHGIHFYVGRTNRMSARLQEHCRPSSSHDSASFAFLLAREATGMMTASYQKAGARKALCNDPKFRQAFLAAKQRVREMDVRYVEERDPTRQALLEIYAAISLQTRYNSFENH
jgi:predicted GIY-YIG superfamily endonuclease